MFSLKSIGLNSSLNPQCPGFHRQRLDHGVIIQDFIYMPNTMSGKKLEMTVIFSISRTGLTFMLIITGTLIDI